MEDAPDVEVPRYAFMSSVNTLATMIDASADRDTGNTIEATKVGKAAFVAAGPRNIMTVILGQGSIEVEWEETRAGKKERLEHTLRVLEAQRNGRPIASLQSTIGVASKAAEIWKIKKDNTKKITVDIPPAFLMALARGQVHVHIKNHIQHYSNNVLLTVDAHRPKDSLGHPEHRLLMFLQKRSEKSFTQARLPDPPRT
jgi:hypothetical protein